MGWWSGLLEEKRRVDDVGRVVDSRRCFICSGRGGTALIGGNVRYF